MTGAGTKVVTGTLLLVVTVAASQHRQAVSAMKAKAARYTAQGNRGLDVRSEALARQAIEEMWRQDRPDVRRRRSQHDSIVRILGFWPPRMMLDDNCRSRLDSTLATTAGESEVPHGVRSPNESLNQVVKSTTPDFSTSRPSLS